MKIFKNKFFAVCLCVAVAISGLSSTLALMGHGGVVRNAVGTIATPFRWVATVFTNAAEGFGGYFQSIRTLREQNEALRQENQAHGASHGPKRRKNEKIYLKDRISLRSHCSLCGNFAHVLLVTAQKHKRNKLGESLGDD